MDEWIFAGNRKGKRRCGAAGKVPVFGILERGGKVTVEVVADVQGETLPEMAIREVKRGCLISTDKSGNYNGLVSSGFRHRRTDQGKRFANGKISINGIGGFWSFGKKRLLKYHGVNGERSPSHLKELEFRYNHRDRVFFDNIVQLLARYNHVAYAE